MELIINGQKQEIVAATVMDIIEHYELQDKQLVVEVDGCIIERDHWQTTAVKPGISIELVHFVGGG